MVENEKMMIKGEKNWVKEEVVEEMKKWKRVGEGREKQKSVSDWW